MGLLVDIVAAVLHEVWPKGADMQTACTMPFVILLFIRYKLDNCEKSERQSWVSVQSSLSLSLSLVEQKSENLSSQKSQSRYRYRDKKGTRSEKDARILAKAVVKPTSGWRVSLVDHE